MTNTGAGGVASERVGGDTGVMRMWQGRHGAVSVVVGHTRSRAWRSREQCKVGRRKKKWVRADGPRGRRREAGSSWAGRRGSKWAGPGGKRKRKKG